MSRKILLPSLFIIRVKKELPEKYREKQKEYDEEEGWWENEFPVVRVWVKPDKDKKKVAGIMVHEFVEAMLEAGFKVKHKEAHFVAEMIEQEFKKYLDMVKTR